MKLRMPEMPPAILLAALGEYNLLPAIVFMPTRRRCDQAASETALMRRDTNGVRRDARRDFMRSCVEQYPEIRGHRHWDTIIRGGVASHHAGHIPAWKLVIEKLMWAGLLDAIFATATVAAGVDFPARTVVLTVADARTGSGWRQLNASELQQMTGRAGRRGRDNVGFVVAAPGLHQDPQRIAELLKARPDPLVSQFRATYTTLLNLLDAYGNFAQVREIAERSFAHREAALQIAQLEKAQAESKQKIEKKFSLNVVQMLLRYLSPIHGGTCQPLADKKCLKFLMHCLESDPDKRLSRPFSDPFVLEQPSFARQFYAALDPASAISTWRNCAGH